MKTNRANLPWAQLAPGFHFKQVGAGRPGFSAFIFRGQPGSVAAINAATPSVQRKKAFPVYTRYSGMLVSFRRKRSVATGDALATIVALPAGRRS